MKPQKNRVLEVLPEWGPEYEISLDLKINIFIHGSHQSIFRFLASEVETGNWFRIGQRTPGLWTEKYSTGNLHLSTNIDSNYNQYFNRELGKFKPNQWYHLDISQKKEGQNGYFFEVKVDGVRKVHMKNDNPKQFKDVKVYAGYGSNVANAEIRNFVACQLEESVGCLDSCLATTCPSNTVYYLLKCSDHCLIDDCQSGTPPSSDKCQNCLETCAPASCSTSTSLRSSCQHGENCFDLRSIQRCKTCASFNIFSAMIKCASRSKPRDIANCLGENVYSHCKVCVCWAVCKFGMTSVCSYCNK